MIMEKVISMWNNQALKIVFILSYLPLFAENKNYIISSEYLQNNLNSRPCVDSVITSLPFFHEGVLEAGMDDDWDFLLPDTVDYSYQITLNEGRNIFVDTCDPLTDFDTVLGIFDECGNSVSIIESDDGAAEFCPEAGIDPPNWASIIENVYLEAGTYYIVISGFNSTTPFGNYKIAIGLLPEIIGSDIASDDSYVDIYFSEGVYSNPTSSGEVEISDFAISIDGGTATNVNIQYLSNISGNPLSGGEDSIRIFINIIGESSGDEQITIHAETNASIFNSFGIGVLTSATITQKLSDQIAPLIQQTIPADGAVSIPIISNMEIEFSEPVVNGTGDEINNSNASNSIEMIDIETGGTIPFSITVISNQTFIIDPDTTLPEFAFIEANFFNLQDLSGNNLANSTVGFQTADETAPLIEGSGLANTNQYCYIDFDEGVYSNENGSGGISMDDLYYEFNSNSGNCDSVKVLEIVNYTGSILSGGETLIYAYVQLFGAPSGSETIFFKPVDGASIFDQFGNPMHPSNETNLMTFNASAIIDSLFIADSNEYLDVIFSNGVYGDTDQINEVEINDFQFTLNPNNGNATNVQILSLTNVLNNNLEGGEEIIRFNLSFNELPSGTETITISPLQDNTVFNSSGVIIPQSESKLKSLNDQMPPSGSIDTENDAVDIGPSQPLTITFSDSLSNSDNTPLNKDTLMSMITLQYPDSGNQNIDFDISWDENPTVLYINPINDYGSDAAIYFNFQGSLQDSSKNVVDFNFTANFTIEDYVAPKIMNVILATDNSYIDLVFDDQIYGFENQSGTMVVEDILVEITPDGSSVNNCIVTSLTKTDSNFLIGGEYSIRVHLQYNDTPNGDETITLRHPESESIFDEAGNQFSGTELASRPLYDILPPSVEYVSLPIDSYIVLMESTPITFDFNEDIIVMNYEVTSNVNGVLIEDINYLEMKEINSLEIILQPPFASFDNINIYFSYLEDDANLSTVDIAYTFPTPILGDYDLDSKITHNDLWDLVENWEANNLNYELGPVTGEAPHFIPNPDSKFDIEDGMAFVQIWSWYQKEYGEIIEDTELVGKPLEVSQLGDELLLFINDSITSGQIHFNFDAGESPLSFSQLSNYDGAMYLSYQHEDKGYSILEFARTEILENDTIRIALDKEELDLGIQYAFYGINRDEVQKGYFDLEYNPIPTSVSLHPAYPNPFNPLTTLKYDIPDMSIAAKTYLSIFDIRGREIELLMNSYKTPGSYNLNWNASEYSSGVYFAQLRFGNQVRTQKIILLK